MSTLKDLSKKMWTPAFMFPFAGPNPYSSMDQYVNDRLSPGGGVVFVGGLPLNGAFFFLASLFTAAFVIFWMLMLVDCLKRQWPGKLLWAGILLVSLPLQLYWLSALLYYLLVKIDADHPVGWRQRWSEHLRAVVSKLRGGPKH